YSLIPTPRARATEIDYGFLLDLAVQTTVSPERIHGVAERVSRVEQQAGYDLAPAERRRVVAHAFAEAVKSRWRNDRVGRNVVFYVDAFPPEQLSSVERSAWQRRSGKRASE